MNPQLFTIILLLALTGFSTNKNEAAKKSRDDIARCTGSTPCRACSNCSACKWCNAGGTCGICATLKKTIPAPYLQNSRLIPMQSPYKKRHPLLPLRPFQWLLLAAWRLTDYN